METVCVVLATYNGQKFIEEQLNSLISQTRKPNFIVISDGMSSDSTVNICHRVLQNSGIEYKIMTSNNRLSVIDNFQKALENSVGDYIFFCDQDDVWMPKKIEVTIEEMQKYSASMAFCNAAIVDTKLCPIHVRLWDKIGYKQTERIRVIERCDNDFIDELIKHNVVTGMCMCITDEAKKMVLPFSRHALHDTWMTFILAATHKIVAINEELVLYRQHANNVVGASKSIKRMIDNAPKYLNYIKSRQCVFEEIAIKLGNVLSVTILDNLHNYVQYLGSRIDYMSGNGRLIDNYLMISLYKKYEANHIYVLLQDLFLHCENKIMQK